MNGVRVPVIGAVSLACMMSCPVMAQGWPGDTEEFPDFGESTPFIYVDGVNQVGELSDDFGRAFIDASANQVLIESGSRSFLVSFSEIADAASAGNVIRKARINAEMDYVFRGGGTALADGGMGMPNPWDSPGLTNFRDFCGALQCQDRFSGWVGDWSFGLNPPSMPPPPQPAPPPPAERCSDAFAEIVEARLAVDAAEAVCKTATNRGKYIQCGVMVLYGAIRTTTASHRAAECVVPPPAPPPIPPGSGYWGWTF